MNKWWRSRIGVGWVVLSVWLAASCQGGDETPRPLEGGWTSLTPMSSQKVVLPAWTGRLADLLKEVTDQTGVDVGLAEKSAHAGNAEVSLPRKQYSFWTAMAEISRATGLGIRSEDGDSLEFTELEEPINRYLMLGPGLLAVSDPEPFVSEDGSDEIPGVVLSYYGQAQELDFRKLSEVKAQDEHGRAAPVDVQKEDSSSYLRDQWYVLFPEGRASGELSLSGSLIGTYRHTFKKALMPVKEGVLLVDEDLELEFTTVNALSADRPDRSNRGVTIKGELRWDCGLDEKEKVRARELRQHLVAGNDVNEADLAWLKQMASKATQFVIADVRPLDDHGNFLQGVRGHNYKLLEHGKASFTITAPTGVLPGGNVLVTVAQAEKRSYDFSFPKVVPAENSTRDEGER